jgi:hypothetical protein
MRNRVCRAAVALALVGLAGCGQGKKKVEDFTPAADNARKALAAALDHWKAGNAPGPVPGQTPGVEVVDSAWRGGLKLREYEILSEEPPANNQGPRTFTVKLTPAQGPPVEAKYMVLGIDPLLVYRDKDFAKLSGAGM